MAESTSVALAAATIPNSAEIARAEKFVRERFLHEGEDPLVALARVGGVATPRRRALETALAELEEDPKTKNPSTAWRREFSLLLGLERLLSDEEPKLEDGTVLSAHQVDALSGTLTALLAEAQRSADGNGRGATSASPELLASADILGPDGASSTNGNGSAATPVADADAQEEDEDEDEDEEEDEDEDDEDLGPVQRAAPDEEEEDEDEDEEEPRRTRTTRRSPSRRTSPRRSPATGSMRRTRRSPSRSSPRTPTRPSDSGSSTRPAPARRWLRWASWRPRRRAGC